MTKAPNTPATGSLIQEGSSLVKDSDRSKKFNLQLVPFRVAQELDEESDSTKLLPLKIATALYFLTTTDPPLSTNRKTLPNSLKER